MLRRIDRPQSVRRLLVNSLVGADAINLGIGRRRVEQGACTATWRSCNSIPRRAGQELGTRRYQIRRSKPRRIGRQ